MEEVKASVRFPRSAGRRVKIEQGILRGAPWRHPRLGITRRRTAYHYRPHLFARPGTTSEENDGTGLYFLRNRYYSPTLQRFISEDPDLMEWTHPDSCGKR